MNSVVYNLDCMVGMRDYPDKYFDLAVVDPPYGIERFKKASGTTRFKSSKMMQETGLTWDKKPTQEYWDELFRVSENQIVFGANNFSMPPSEYFLIWDKQQTVDNFATAEYAWVSMGLKKPAKIFKFAIHQHNQITKIHPTEKPIKLYDWVYSNYLYCPYCDNVGSYYEDVVGDGGSQMLQSCECALGEGRSYRVLDTHLGSGSNRIAADKAGNIDFIGYELDKDYFEAQEKRWKNYKAQLTMF